MLRLKKNFRISVLIVLPALVVLISQPACKKDNLEDLLKDQVKGADSIVCDTSFVISFQNDIVPILNLNCYACHSASFAQAGYKVDSYDDLMINVDDAGNPLLCRIKGNTCGTRMPQGGELSNCNIDRVEAWIRNGANDN